MNMETKNIEESDTLQVAEPNQDEEIFEHNLNVVPAKLSPVQEDPNKEENIDSSCNPTYLKSLPFMLVTVTETGEVLKEANEPSVGNSGSSCDTSKRTGSFESQTETSSDLKRRAEVSRETARSVRSLKEILADLKIGENVESTTEESNIVDSATSMGFDYSTFSKDLQYRSQAATSEDILPHRGVCISEESSISSLDISHGICSLMLSDSVDSGHKVPLVESPPPKRKITSPDFSENADVPTKMVRISLEVDEITSKSTRAISKKPNRKRAHSVTEEESMLKSSPDTNVSAETDRNVDTGAASASSGYETRPDNNPVIEYPADSEDSSKSERSSLKRTHDMSPALVEDITETSLDVKRKKETE